MSAITINSSGEAIVVRATMSIEEAISIRDSLIEDYRGIPKLNQDTFTDFHQWLLDEFEDCAVQALSSFKPANPESDQAALDEDSPSTFEPW